MGFGTEILFILLLGLVVLGPKRLHAMLGQMAQAKAELENAARGMKSQLATELEGASLEEKRMVHLNARESSELRTLASTTCRVDPQLPRQFRRQSEQH